MSLKALGWVDHVGMIVHMHHDQLVTLDQVRAILAGTSDTTFSPAADADRYECPGTGPISVQAGAARR